jgi:hypothetical protein
MTFFPSSSTSTVTAKPAFSNSVKCVSICLVISDEFFVG